MPTTDSLHTSVVTRYRRACALSLRGRILDCGGGLGEYLPFLGKDVVLMDHSVVILARTPRVRRVAGDAQCLPFDTNSFDGVWGCAMAQYVDLDRFLQECRRVTRSGGRILILVPNGDSPWDRIKRAVGFPGWREQVGIVTQYTPADLQPHGKVTGEVRFLPFDRLLRRFPKLGHTLMLEIRVTK